MESDNPDLVLDAEKSWIAKEGPATFLMRGIKNAAEAYFMAIGRSDIDYSKEPEEFVYIYGPALWTLPYFGDYQGVATLLSEQMFIMKPGRKTILLAVSIAMARSLPEEWTRKEKIIQNIEEHKKAGYRLPAIAQDFK